MKGWLAVAIALVALNLTSLGSAVPPILQVVQQTEDAATDLAFSEVRQQQSEVQPIVDDPEGRVDTQDHYPAIRDDGVWCCALHEFDVPTYRFMDPVVFDATEPSSQSEEILENRTADALGSAEQNLEDAEDEWDDLVDDVFNIVDEGGDEALADAEDALQESEDYAEDLVQWLKPCLPDEQRAAAGGGPCPDPCGLFTECPLACLEGNTPVGAILGLRNCEELPDLPDIPDLPDGSELCSRMPGVPFCSNDPCLGGEPTDSPLPRVTNCSHNLCDLNPEDCVEQICETAECPDPDSPQGPGSTTVIAGKIVFRDFLGVKRSCNACFVEVWDKDKKSPRTHEHLANVLTNEDGSFETPEVTNRDRHKGQDPYFRVVLGSTYSPATIYDPSGQAYRAQTKKAVQDCPDTACNVGEVMLVLDSSNLEAAFHTYSGIAEASDWLRHEATEKAPSATILLPIEAEPAAAYFHELDLIRLNLENAREHVTITHEWSHFLMDKFYEEEMPLSDCPGQHSIEKDSGTSCGWMEGWADFVMMMPAHADTDSTIHRKRGEYCSSEDPDTCFGFWYEFDVEARSCAIDFDAAAIPDQVCDWDTGSDVEGNVAATLFDLVDEESTEAADGTSYEFIDIWETFANNVDESFPQYYASWQASHSAAEEQDFEDLAAYNTADV